MNAFVARQPIFDKKIGGFGYELLFRSGPDSCFPANTDVDYASSRTVSDGLTLMGLDTVALGKRAFINLLRNMLVKDLAMTLPKNRVVVELLESIDPDEEVLAACRRLEVSTCLATCARASCPVRARFATPRRYHSLRAR
jgi:EAL and modified HD-GYP domain-containing signal transduction protein